eukprot:GHVL01032280.1.p1 GENE.GHVL01032280.1~~GHVL01032280.1.p1  ORF type:complete len:990 (-),score=305.10 GHVL01032280.1:536-3505(-)
MGSKCRAGCPVKNIQAVIDDLVKKNFVVAVFEEVGQYVKNHIKSRFLAQIVSAASPTYRYASDLNFHQGRPIAGVHKGVNGYSFIELYVDERMIRIRENLTEDACRTILKQINPVEPVFYQGRETTFFEQQLVKLKDYTFEEFQNQVKLRVRESLRIDDTHFRVTQRCSRNSYLSFSTAQQVGLLNHPNVPQLIPHLVPDKITPVECKNLIKRWLLSPPTNEMSDNIRYICEALGDINILPNLTVLSLAKTLSILLSDEPNETVFKDIKNCIKSCIILYKNDNFFNNFYTKNNNINEFDKIQNPLLSLASYETGLSMTHDDLITSGEYMFQNIDDVIDDNPIIDLQGLNNSNIDLFFQTNENSIWGKVKPSQIENNLKILKRKKDILLYNINNDFYSNKRKCISKSLIYDPINNILCLKKDIKNNKIFIHPKDRYSSTVTKRFTTKNVETSIEEYKDIINIINIQIIKILKNLSIKIMDHIPSIIQMGNILLILNTLYLHTSYCSRRGWCIPKMRIKNETVDKDTYSMKLTKMAPYWMTKYYRLHENYINETAPVISKTTNQQPVTNDIDIFGITVLTAPNMSGKSTLLRSVLVTALLGNCGMMVPCYDAVIPRYDMFFLRTNNMDLPIEGTSAFGNEMNDMRVMLQGATNRSLVCVDELGSGTSTKDALAICGAILEKMCSLPMHGFFSTHLHELFSLNLKLPTVSYKKIIILKDVSDLGYKFTFHLQDGKCEDSMAWLTAQICGIPKDVIQRCLDLRAHWSETNPQGSHTDPQGSNTHPQVSDTDPQESYTDPQVSDTDPQVSDTDPQGSDTDPQVSDTDPQGSDTDPPGCKFDPLKIDTEEKNIFTFDTIERIIIENTANSNTDPQGSGPHRANSNKIVYIPPGYEPVDISTKKTCVYILIYHDSINRTLTKKTVTINSVYVGETVNIQSRLKHHRSLNKSEEISAFIIYCNDKSEAHKTETQIILKLKNSGFKLINDKLEYNFND